MGTHELICFKRGYDGSRNFGGKDSPLDEKAKREYLSRYVRDIKKFYDLGEMPRKVVTADERADLAARYVPAPLSSPGSTAIDEVEAFSRPAEREYAGWTLYTFDAHVSGRSIEFTHSPTPPVPAAKYDAGAQMRAIAFSYEVKSFPDIPAAASVTNVRSRFFELRRGYETAVKLQLLSDGRLYYLLPAANKTHPSYVSCGASVKGENFVVIEIANGTATVKFNGKTVVDGAPAYIPDFPDSLFVSGGITPLGEWKFTPGYIVTGQGKITEFFRPAGKVDRRETYIGRVRLPYAMGTHLDADSELVLRTKFVPLPHKRAILVVKSVDPCGRIYINGRLAAETKNFLKFEKDITDLLSEGENTIETVVSPRAPEVLYQWHRHSDPYNGWQCAPMRIEYVGGVRVTDVYAATRKFDGGKAITDVSTSFDGSGRAEIRLKQVFPEESAETLIDEFDFDEGETIRRLCLDVKPWSPDAPAVYELSVRATCADGTVSECRIETGFRTIEQKDGEIFLNGERVVLAGALAMQFLAPHNLTPLYHVCPPDELIVEQFAQLRRMNGNTMRLHLLGYGTNDDRYARIADRMGVMLIWTTRLIDGVERILSTGEWGMEAETVRQIKEVRSYPSVIMWEGSNEASGGLKFIDAVYDAYVTAVRKADDTRLICPVSHLYYGGGLYEEPSNGGGYYQDDGKADYNFAPAESSFGWRDPLVVRSAHTYSLLLGYGCDWRDMVDMKWPSQPALLGSKEHAYIISEYAIIGRACPLVPEAKEYFNPDSYELGDERASLGFSLSDEEYELSQAHQSLCALYATKRMRLLDVDGMLWCCLSSGANDGSYLKPIIDFYGYAKFAFYTLRDAFSQDACFIDCDGPIWGDAARLSPVLLSGAGDFEVNVRVCDESGATVWEKTYRVRSDGGRVNLGNERIDFPCDGYYTVTTDVKKYRTSEKEI